MVLSQVPLETVSAPLTISDVGVIAGAVMLIGGPGRHSVPARAARGVPSASNVVPQNEWLQQQVASASKRYVRVQGPCKDTPPNPAHLGPSCDARIPVASIGDHLCPTFSLTLQAGGHRFEPGTLHLESSLICRHFGLGGPSGDTAVRAGCERTCRLMSVVVE